MILPPCSEVCIYSCIYREVVGFRVGGNDFWFALQRGTLSVWVSESAIGEDPCSPWKPTIVTSGELGLHLKVTECLIFQNVCGEGVGRVNIIYCGHCSEHVLICCWIPSSSGLEMTLSAHPGHRCLVLPLLCSLPDHNAYTVSTASRVINPALDSSSFHMSWVAPWPQGTALHLALVLSPDLSRRAPWAGVGLPPLLYLVLQGEMRYIWTLACFVSKFSHSLTQLSTWIFKATT